MISYLKDELIPATSVTRHFGDLLSKLRSHELKRIAVIRNNNMEAVILPIDEYERLAEKASMREHREIYNIVRKRKRTPKSAYVRLADVKKQA